MSEGIVPALNNGVATSEEAAHKVNLSGIQSKKQRYVMILLGQAAEKGVTVGEVRDSTPKYHHGSVSGILSTLHSRDRVVALRQPRGGQTVYVLPEYLNGREARPYGRRDPKLTEHDALREIKAEVWDEGFAAGVNHDMGDRENIPEQIENPYREEQS